MLWVGIDVGGTFTDGVVYDDVSGVLHYAKAASTPDASTRGVLAVLDLLDVDFAAVARFCHGVTIGTNAILERKGAEVWMLVTEGFRDVLEIGRTNRPVLYDLRTLKTRPLMSRDHVLEVRERLMWNGAVRVPLDREQVRASLARVPGGPDVAIAVCLLHAYADPAHEQAVKQIVQVVRPDGYVCTSEEVSPQFREVERFNTTVLNAYIGPLMACYLDMLTGALSQRGYTQDVFIMTSNGGVATATRAKQLPVATVLVRPGRWGDRGGPSGSAARRTESDHLRHGRHQHRCVSDRASARVGDERTARRGLCQPHAADRDQRSGRRRWLDRLDR